MNKLKNKVLKYLNENIKKNILIDLNKEIDSSEIIDLAFKIHKKKIINKKIVINLDRSADYIGYIYALWINGNTIIPTNKNWPKKYINEIFKICKADFILNDKFQKKLKTSKLNLNYISEKKKNFLSE